MCYLSKAGIKLLFPFATKECPSTILSSQQQLPAQNILASRNCFLIFRGPWVLLGSKPPLQLPINMPWRRDPPVRWLAPHPPPPHHASLGLLLDPLLHFLWSWSFTSSAQSTLYTYLRLLLCLRGSCGFTARASPWWLWLLLCYKRAWPLSLVHTWEFAHL